jgi:hypothetical protein
MKYYCKNCKCVIETDRDLSGLQACYICGYRFVDGYEDIIPNYETPEQYWKRTGKSYPENGAVWWRRPTMGGKKEMGDKEWTLCLFRETDLIFGKDVAIVICDPAVPPPDDFVPEGI